MQELEFLGQWITTRGVAPMKGKLNPVREWETPTNVKDIRSYLEFANYYHWFIPGYGSIAAPLTMLMKKDVLWHWGPLQRRAFEGLKSALCAAPLLIYPDPSLPYTVVSDACGDAARGVLMQDQGEGLRPVAFMSRAFKPTKQGTRYMGGSWLQSHTALFNGTTTWKGVLGVSRWRQIINH